MKYQRFVAYVYEYRKGKKEENCGFLRVEARNDNVTVEVHIKCPGLPANERCSVYGFVRKMGLLEGVLLGNAWSETEKLDCMIESEKLENASWKNEFQQFGGIIIRTENGAFFGTEWDDHSIKPENFEPEKNRKVQSATETDENIIPEIQKMEINSDKTSEMNSELDSEITSELNSEANSETNSEMNSGVNSKINSEIKTEIKSPQNGQPTFCPFNDDEFTECQKVNPDDFFKNCPRACALRNNRFLEYGFYHFGHLLVGRRTDGRRILGVPGGYGQQDRFMANMFGFPYFKESREIQISGGRGGYWYRLINPSNTNQRNCLF